MMVSGQQLIFKQASAKVRAEGIKPFTKAFGKRMKSVMAGLKGKSRSKPRGKSVKNKSAKRKKSRTSTKRTTKSKSNPKKSVVARKGTSGMTRVKKLLIGLGVGTTFSTIAALTRVREIEGAAPIIDAAVGGGVEAQIGTAIPRLIRIVAGRAGFNGFNGGGNGGMALEGA